jgi:hypothetical protein
MKAWAILLSYLLVNTAAAQAPRLGTSASPASGPSASFTGLASKMAALPPVDAIFPAQAVIAVQLTVLRQQPDSADERTEVYAAWRDAGAPAASAVPEAQIQAVGDAMLDLLPSAGMRSCDNDEAATAGAAPYLAAELAILVAGHRPLKLRSDASCAHMLPWNVTNGASLYAISAAAPGQALMALAQALCGQCLPAGPARPPLALAAAPHALGFAQLYGALTARWRQLGRDHAAYDVKLQTLPLSAALDWMDHGRFRRRLADSERHARGTARMMAHELLRPLLPYPAPPCVTRAMAPDCPAHAKYNNRQAGCTL